MAGKGWLNVVAYTLGSAFSAGVTNYFPVASTLAADTTVELRAQLVCRETYTWANLWVNVTANATSGTSTVSSRKNTDVGAQSVSIGAGLTGNFADDTNHDCLADGDTCNFKIVVGAGGAITIRAVTSTFASDVDSPILVTSYVRGSSQNSNTTRYAPIFGLPGFDSTETFSKYTWRVAATLSNLRVFVFGNTVNGASTFSTRKNTAPGAQSVSITASTSGAFEDTTNSDTIASGDLVNYQFATGGSSGTMSLTIAHMKSVSTGRQVAAAYNAQSGSGGTVDRWMCVEGQPSIVTTESLTQIAARIAFTAKNLFVRVVGNTRDDTWTVRLRKNTANSTLVVSIGAGLTGVFEDTVNTTAYIATDVLNFQYSTGGGAGTMTIFILGFELTGGVGTLLDCFPSAAPSGSIVPLAPMLGL